MKKIDFGRIVMIIIIILVVIFLLNIAFGILGWALHHFWLVAILGVSVWFLFFRGKK